MEEIKELPKVRCEDCIHAKVGKDEICFCNEFYWMGMRLSNIGHVIRRCEDFIDND